MTPTFRMHRSVLVMAALVSGGILTAVQNTTLERLKAILVADPAAGTYRPGLGRMIWSTLPALHPVDWLLLGSLLATLLALLVIERRSGRIRAELQMILADGRGTLVFLGILAATAARFYLAPGEFALGDSPAHVARIWTVAESFSQSHWPSWSFFNYGGYPFLQFYGPFFFLLSGAAVWACGDLVWATKVVLFLLHAGSAFPVYAWARATGLERSGALIAALAYVFSFLHTHTVIWTGALPVALVYAVFPIVLWALERTLFAPSRKWIVVLSLSVAALVGAHHGYAAFALQLALLYAIARLVLAGTSFPVRGRLAPAALSILGGILLSGGPALRVVLEGSWVHLPGTGLPLAIPAVPGAQFLKDILVWRNTWTGWTTAYIGVSVMLYALAGTYLAFRRGDAAPDRMVRRLIAVVAVFSLLCAATSGRLINLALPWLALAAGGVTRTRALSPRACLILVVILLVDLAPTTIQSPYRTDRAWLTAGLCRVADAVEPHRALVGFTSEAGTHFSHWGAYGDTGLIVPTGYFPQGAPRSLASITALVDAMNTPEYAATTLADLLYLWDVGALVTHARDHFTTPEHAGPPLTPVHPASPMLFSPRLAVAGDDSLLALQGMKLEFGHTADEEERRRYLARLGPWVNAMGIDRGRAEARVIFVADPARIAPIPGAAAPREAVPVVTSPIEPAAKEGDVATPLREAGPAGVEVTRYDVELRKVTISCRTHEPGYLRIAFSWYPTLRVLMDGEAVTPWCSLLGAIVVAAEPGEHTIELAPSAPWRTRSPGIALIGVLMILSAALITRRPAA